MIGSLVMHSGEIIDDRFVVQAVAGSGGMGTVYRSKDLHDDRLVAVKVLGEHMVTDSARFARETRVLADLSLAHPAIVRYVANGVTAHGAPYLVMEWLEGQDLATMLARRSDGLSEAEAVSLLKRVAAALAAAHHRDVIHRDIKPSNLFLVDGDPRQVKLIDFGLARSILATQQLTRTGTVLGTAGYMAPEQVEGARDLDARADVYALGCVLYECLTGQPAFAGDRPVAVLAKVLLHDAPRVREVRPSLSLALDALVARMLSKEREERPADAAEVLTALESLGVDEATMSDATTMKRTSSRPSPALTGGEQQLLSMLLIDRGQEEPVADDGPTLLDEIPSWLRELAAPLKGRLVLLSSGAVAVLARSVGDATSQAARAAMCALSIQSAMEGSRVALATGLAEVTGRWPVGPVADRAAEILEEAPAAKAPGVYVDEVTAGLLGARFDVRGQGPALELLGEHATPGGRRLLGRRTPCVGRGKEIAFLTSTFEECVGESMAQAVLVTGVAGVGKSRIYQELLERVRRSGEVTELAARGDPLAAGSAFALVAQLVRTGVGLHEGDDVERQYAQLRRHLRSLFEEPHLRRLCEFLGELVRAPTTDEPSPLLVAARNDSRIMSEQLKEAFLAWLGAQSREGPLLIALEDLHWGDLPSVTYLEESVRRHVDSPMMILALARPEVADLFPGLWANSTVQKMSLGPLRRSASERLVRAALGDDVSPETVDRIVTQAGGNAFYLEELIRHVAERGDRDLPGTVLAMAQARLNRLDTNARLLLRAGSILGDRFWDGAVATLLGDALSERDRASWLEMLVAAEVLEPGRSEKFPLEAEYRFRHGLLREAAYAMLTANDRHLGHRLAAEWLEAAGEKDALALAEHFERGGEPSRAVPYLVKAGQAAIEGLNLDAAQALSERGLALGAVGTDRGALLLLQATRRLWLDDYIGLGAIAEEALTLVPEGSPPWLLSVGLLSLTGSFGGDPGALMRALKKLQDLERPLVANGPSARACSMLNASLIHTGQREMALALRTRLEASRSEGADLVFEGWVRITRSVHSLYGLAPLGEAVGNVRAAAQCFEEARDDLSWAVATFHEGWCLFEAGALVECENTCRSVLERSEQMGLRFPVGFATYYLGLSLVLQGKLEAGREAFRSCFEHSNAAIASSAMVSDALALLVVGEAERAEAAAAALGPRTQAFPIINAHALAVEASAALAMGRAERARDLARHGLAARDRVGASPYYESLLRLALVGALHALGDDEAATALDVARRRLREQAESFNDEALRRSYLDALPANARLMSL